MRGFPRRAHAGLVAAAAVLVGGIAVAGMHNQDPVRDVRLLSGAAWLSSAKVGQLTLLDGSSVEVAAQVQVAPPGNDIEVVQQGSTAYAIDRTAGTVRRVDGATFEQTQPEIPIPDARAGLTAFPGPDVLYTLDTRRGILANTDPVALSRHGELLSLASELSAGSAVVDDAGTLWAIDAATGDLARVAGGSRSIRRQVAQPGRSLLTVAGGHPIVVDTTARKAIRIDRDNGRVSGTLDLDLRPEDTVQASGSPSAERLYLVTGRGALIICDLPANRCDNVVPLNAGSTFGAPVEAGNRLFVPNYSTGQVWIIDLDTSRVVAKPTVLSAAGAFQLLTRDGVVFYNDSNSARAGVIQLDGSLVPVVKYDASDPGKGVQVANPGQPRPERQQPDPEQPRQQPDPERPDPEQPDPQRPDDPNDPVEPQPEQPQPNDPDAPSPDPVDPPPDPDDPPPPVLDITMSDTSPTVDDVITLRVNNSSGPDPVAAHWIFGDGEEGDGVTTSHRWATAGGFLVAVTATLPDGRQASISVNITVSEVPTVRLTVNPPTGGTISGGGINCPGSCSVDVRPDTRLTLTAAPDASHLLGNWDGACSGTAPTCDVTMNSAKTVRYTFNNIPTPTFTLTVSRPTSGSVTGGGISCGTTCTITRNQGTRITLNANPDQTHNFDRWGGACAGQGSSCSLTLNKNENVSVTFTAKPPPPPPPPAPTNVRLNCEYNGNGQFSCFVSFDGGTGTTSWRIGGTHFSQFDGDFSIRGGCIGTRTGVSVTVSNVSGSDTGSDTVQCEGEPK